MYGKQRKRLGRGRYKSGVDYNSFKAYEKGEFVVIWPNSREGISQLYQTIVSIEN